MNSRPPSAKDRLAALPRFALCMRLTVADHLNNQRRLILQGFKAEIVGQEDPRGVANLSHQQYKRTIR